MLRYAIAGVAIVATALTGCGSSKDKPTAAEVTSAATSVVAAATNAPGYTPRQAPNAVAGQPDSLAPKGKAEIIIDGEVSDLTGPVECFTAEDEFYVVIGDDPSTSFSVANLTTDSSPKVKQVSITSGKVMIAVLENLGGSAKVTKKGDNYVVKGKGQRVDMEKMDVIDNVPFTIDATCGKTLG